MYLRKISLDCEFSRKTDSYNCSSSTRLRASKKERLQISYEWNNALVKASGKYRTNRSSNLRNKIEKL
jgi:hypothetical protein